jgi:integrase
MGHNEMPVGRAIKGRRGNAVIRIQFGAMRTFSELSGVDCRPSGLRFELLAYVMPAVKTVPTLRSKHVTPHGFRHATAVRLVSTSVDLTVTAARAVHSSGGAP